MICWVYKRVGSNTKLGAVVNKSIRAGGGGHGHWLLEKLNRHEHEPNSSIPLFVYGNLGIK